VADGGFLRAGKNTVTLVAFGPEGADFKGFLVQPTGGVLSEGTSGAIYSEDRAGACGWGHNEPSVKISVSWTLVPDERAKEVTFSGFVMKDVNTWYKLESTLAVRS
jgi:hypothetical protein